MNASTSYNSSARTGSKFLARVFLYMFIGILITAIVSCAVGLIFSTAFPLPNGSAVVDGQFKADLAVPYFILLICSFIGIIPVMIWIHASALKGNGSAWLPYIIFTILMGFLVSSATMCISWWVIALAFGITSVSFIGMFLIGYLCKKDLSILALAGSGLLFGLAIMSVVNLIWMFVFPAAFVWYYWLVEAGLLVFVVLITIVDANQIRKIQESGMDVPDIAIVCALNLYSDFIYIFLRVLLLLVRIFGSR